MFEARKLNVAYEDLQVLWDVSFDVKDGEIVAIIGSNGAGKTTLLNTIIGILKPLSGELYFKGERIDGLPSNEIVRRGISLVPEGRHLFPDLTVYENLYIGGYTLKDEEIFKDRLEFIYSLFPILKERNQQKAGTLSGGEQQMLAIGRALVSSPEMLMFDEPSLGLAPMLVVEVFRVIEQLRDEGITILLVEQNVKKSLEVADRGYVLENGRILFEGSGRELLEDERVKKAYLVI